MKEQEQKNLNKQEQTPQQNQDKVKTQNPKTKVIVWSVAGAAAAALSSVVSFSTIFSNQRKVSFLDKVLQSIKIDVKDKETKTKDDIKTIADFVASGLNNKLYELIVETEEDQVNKQPLDKDKPYTTFRTKFAIRNKVTKAQSNFISFEFKDIKPPKEKAELNELGKERVVVKFFDGFRRELNVASKTLEEENGKYKHFEVFLKDNNSDDLKYEIVNIKAIADDKKSEAIISYQLKVKSINDEKFTSDVLEVKFDDFAKNSEQLTEYLKTVEFSYENADVTYIQDAIETKVIGKKDGNTLPSYYRLIFDEFKKEGEHPKKIDAKVRIRDNSNNIISEARDIEITGFKKYLTPEELNTYIDQVQFDVENKATQEISNITAYAQLSKTNFDESIYEVDSNTFMIEKLDDLVSLNIHFRIKEKYGKPGIYSKQRTIKIKDFKMPQKLVDDLAQQVSFDVSTKASHMAYDFWDNFDSIDVKVIDERCEFIQESIKVKQTDKDKITITYKIKDKKNDTISQEYSKTINSFKTSTDNIADFSYEIIEHDGHKAAFLNDRKNLTVFKVPAKIGSFKVIKVGTLFSNVVNNSPLYGVILEEGIQEVSNLIISTDNINEYARIAAIKLPKTIKKINSLINGDSSALAYLEMYDNVETIEGQLFSTFCNYINKSDDYKAEGTDSSTYYFKLINEFHNFFTVLTTDLGRQGKGSFKFNLLESGEANKKLKLNHASEFSFLESSNGEVLYKAVDNNETTIDFSQQLGYKKINKNALSGLKIQKIDLHLPNLDKDQQKNFILERMKKLEEIKLTHHKFDEFPMRLLLNDITSLKSIIFPDFSSDSTENILDFSLNGKSEKVNLPSKTKQIKAKIIETNNIENLKELTQLKTLHHNSFSNFKNITLDFSNCPIKEIKHRTFQWSTKGVTIILPSGIEKVDPFVFYFTEKNDKYNILGNPFSYSDPELEQIILTNIENSIIKVKNTISKPDGWSKYWVGQYWKDSQPNGIDNELKIEWNSN
ncbi:leucine-rich repeat protein [Metamycoplasma hyosynoviae]|uniref:leucine-rich repeat protein n=1 Tax=Metamycoplasma hyosynoviae TaxID=29559 RepID=UPI0023581510|nr:leucine-rich repeat protein [Metamycoplasma hyosynoviae]MDC8919620.1 leucine-rich repeat protein [Metamycoplasma hyosynoviae]